MAVTINPKQQRFIEEYLRDYNATQAAIRAGYSERTARVIGCNLLTKVNIAEEISTRRKRMAEEAGATPERVIREYTRLAFFDPRKLFYPDGTPKAITDLDDDTAAVIAGLDVLEEYSGSGEERHLSGIVKKWKIANKQAALDKLGEHLGLFGDKGGAGDEVDNMPPLVKTLITSATISKPPEPDALPEPVTALPTPEDTDHAGD